MGSKRVYNVFLYVLLLFLSLVFLSPVIIVLLNSFKSRFSISQEPFLLPNGETFTGFENYLRGLADTGFLSAFFWPSC